MEKEMATHSSVLAWRIPGTGEPGGLPCMGSHRVGHNWHDLAAAAAVLKEILQPKEVYPLYEFLCFSIFPCLGLNSFGGLTGFYMHHLLYVCVVCSVTQSCLTLLWPHGLEPTRLLCPWDFPGKNTEAGCHFLLQGIFLTQESNPCVLH